MAQINLLPWRDERRQERQREFLTILGGTIVLGVVLVLLADFAFSTRISAQEGRNRYLQSNIEHLNKQVREIAQLEKKRQSLLDRMKIIQSLQGERPLIVRLFDEQVRTLPDGVFFQSLNRKGKRIDVTGIAESNNRVSSLMRNLDASEWFDSPNLTGVSAQPQYGEQASSFKLSFVIAEPKPDGEAK